MYETLTLKFGLDQWALYCKRKYTTGFSDFEKKIFKRDKYSCGYCGFTAKINMAIMNKDHDYRNNTSGNMITACPFCLQCNFLEQVGASGKNGGILVYLPEITQAELNGTMHTLFCSIANATTHEASSKEMYNAFRLRAQPIENTYGEGRSNPLEFSQMVINTPTDNPEHIYNEILKDLRLVPNINDYKEQIIEWSRDAANVMSDK